MRTSRWLAVGSLVSLFVLGGLASAEAQPRQVRRVERGTPRTPSTGSIRYGERSTQRGIRRDDDRGRVVRESDRSRATVVVRDDPPPQRIIRRTPRYYRPVPRGTVIRRLPVAHQTVIVNNTTYIVSDGCFYAAGPRPEEYVVVRPPVGVQVEAIPSDYIAINIGGFSFYYYDDVYYDESLTVVETPIGGYIHELPPAHEVVVIRDERYYRCGGAYYRPFLREGRTAYVRVDVRF